jgi:hypothetical protein
MLAPLKENPAQLGGVAALQVKGNFMFDPATHRDFLGAILNTGQQQLWQLWQRTGPSVHSIHSCCCRLSSCTAPTCSRTWQHMSPHSRVKKQSEGQITSYL